MLEALENASRLHRGLLEALRNHWFLWSRAHRGSLEAFENYCFPCGKRIEASSRLARGPQKPFVFCAAELIEAHSRLSKTIVFLMENASRLHRGLLEALRNHLFFMQQNSSRLARAFLSVSMSLSDTILVSSRRLLACFNLVRAKIATPNISTSNLSLTESVGLRWRLIFALLTVWLGCVFWP